jgi:Putative Ig domain
MPKYITIENLDIRSAHPNYQFTSDTGATMNYSDAASSIYVEKGENITVRNCIIHDSANGFFVASSDDTVSRDILVEGNYIFGNGIVGSAFQHNNYTAAIGITFQYNRFGPLRAGANGNALKDRSAGTVIRYNWIESGNRQLDLVDAEDSVQIQNDAAYHKTFVYGNLLIEPDGAGNSQIAHYGGDSGNEPIYRKGKLYFYNNTVISTRAGNTTLFRLSTNDETCDARNNIFYNTAPGANLALLAEVGTLSVSNNWIKSGWRNSHEGTDFGGSVTVAGAFITGTAPDFADFANQDFHLITGSAAINAGIALHVDAAGNNVVRQYVKHQSSEARPVSGALDLGAYEFAAVAPMQILTNGFADGARARPYSQSAQATGGSGNFTWSVTAGSLPFGLWLDAATGTIHGKPVLRGTWNFTLGVQDAQNPGTPLTKNFTINVKLYN